MKIPLTRLAPLTIAAVVFCVGCKEKPKPAKLATSTYSGPKQLQAIGKVGDQNYYCLLDPVKVKATGGWSFGSGEPPLGPDKAFVIARDALKAMHPEIKDFSSDVVSLIRYTEGAVYQVIFSSSGERAIGQRSDLRDFMNIYVYMDGTYEVPLPVSASE